MPTVLCHRWDVTPERAAQIQRSLRGRVITRGGPGRPRSVAGADVAYDTRGDAVHAAMVVLQLPRLEVIETVSAAGRARFPYIPGYLSFREAPIVLEAFSRLRARPDLLLCDGQGIAHPRGVGLACHLGLILGIPAIGCAKTRLVGTHREPPVEAGGAAPLDHAGRRVGAVLRTRAGARPIYVSPGHRIGVRSAVRWVLACCDGHRIPEPIRLAHIEANRLRATARRTA